MLDRPCSSSCSPLRLRFLNEAEYKALWGFTSDADVDLDFDGSLSVGEAKTLGWPAPA